jgi:hypothetical protein
LKSTIKRFSYAMVLAGLISGPVAAQQTATNCFIAAGPHNPFDIPFFSISYPEPEIAILHLNGKNIFTYLKKRVDLNPGHIELDEKIVSIAKYPIPCPYNKNSGEFPPRIRCHFSDRYSMSLHSYKYEGQLVTVSDFVITEPQYGGGFSGGPRLYCKNNSEGDEQ